MVIASEKYKVLETISSISHITFSERIKKIGGVMNG